MTRKSIQEVRDISEVDDTLLDLPPLGFTDPVSGIRVEMIDITPDLAAEWLGKNTRNRNLRRRTVVSTMVRDMINGDWLQIGDTICWSADMILLDGQHRLEAIKESGIPQRYIVVFGLPLKAQDPKDTGTKRLFSDILTLRGEVNTLVLAGIANKCLLWEKGVYRFENRGITPSRSELLDFFLKHQDSLRETATAIGTLRGILCPPVPPSIIGLVYWLLARIDEDTSELFFQRMKDGVNLEENHPILTFRDKVVSERMKPSSLPASHWCAFLIKTWNAFVDDVPLYQLRFKPGGRKPEKMPMPRGYEGFGED